MPFTVAVMGEASWCHVWPWCAPTVTGIRYNEVIEIAGDDSHGSNTKPKVLKGRISVAVKDSTHPAGMPIDAKAGAQLVEGFPDKPCRDKGFFMMGSTTADVDDSAAEKKAVLVSVIARQRLLFSSN